MSGVTRAAHARSYERLNATLAASRADRFVNFWNLGYRDVGVDPAASDSRRFNADSRRLVAELCRDVTFTGRRVLDLGCGRGGSSSQVTAAGAQLVVGLDQSLGAVSFSKRNGNVVTQGDCERLPFVGGCADVVLNLESSQFYDKPDRFFSECARVLRPGGRFLYGDSFPSELVAVTLRVLKAAGFVIESARDVTANVLASRLAVGTAHARALGDDPFLANFAGAPGGRVFDDLASGRYAYYLFQLRKGGRARASSADDTAAVRTFATRALRATGEAEVGTARESGRDGIRSRSNDPDATVEAPRLGTISTQSDPEATS